MISALCLVMQGLLVGSERGYSMIMDDQFFGGDRHLRGEPAPVSIEMHGQAGSVAGRSAVSWERRKVGLRSLHMNATIHQHAGNGLAHSTAYEIAFFLALLTTALALGAAVAHALELPNKIGLPRDEYFIVQKAYLGWNRLVYLLAIELVSMVAVAAMSRHEPYVLWPVVLSIACLLCAQALFWIYTYPANAATESWTVIPDNWHALRSQWEYSHAAGAALQILAMSALIVAALARARGR